MNALHTTEWYTDSTGCEFYCNKKIKPMSVHFPREDTG